MLLAYVTMCRPSNDHTLPKCYVEPMFVLMYVIQDCGLEDGSLELGSYAVLTVGNK